jgi:hypothetical protein
LNDADHESWIIGDLFCVVAQVGTSRWDAHQHFFSWFCFFFFFFCFFRVNHEMLLVSVPVTCADLCQHIESFFYKPRFIICVTRARQKSCKRAACKNIHEAECIPVPLFRAKSRISPSGDFSWAWMMQIMNLGLLETYSVWWHKSAQVAGTLTNTFFHDFAFFFFFFVFSE